MLKSIKLNKGVIVFYIILALLAMLCALRMNNLNIANSDSNNQIYCA